MTKTARLAITIIGHPNKTDTKRRALRRKAARRKGTWTEKATIEIQTE